jgi:pyruvate/2-oxoglutarate dehydrogenase complex dihydrolipoamide dehydrogenase (E3) component
VSTNVRGSGLRGRQNFLRVKDRSRRLGAGAAELAFKKTFSRLANKWRRDPEVATVGLTPVRGAEAGIALDTHRLELSKVERAFIDGEEDGFAVLYTRKGTDDIVGATLVAAHAGEMISELTLAITNKLPMKALAETVHCYPTQAKLFRRIALAYGK